MRVIGLDVHGSFAQVAELETGVLRQCGRVDLVRNKVLAFARTLRADDEVVLKATGNDGDCTIRVREPVTGRQQPVPVRVQDRESAYLVEALASSGVSTRSAAAFTLAAERLADDLLGCAC
jgi:hypothetical protein